MNRGRTILAALLLALVPLVAAACGGDDEGDTTVNNTTTVVTGGDESGDGGVVEETTLTVEEPPDDDGNPGPSADDDPDRVVSLESFRSPTGNIACAMTAKSVRCDIAEKTWTAARPQDCPGSSDFGQGLTLGATGAAAVACAGDTVLNPQAPVLEYDSVSRVGPISCESDESGIECSNASGGEFSLSRNEYELG